MRNLVLFGVMSFVWGLTWAAIKFGLMVLPPLFLAALRYLFAAAMLIAFVPGWRMAFAEGRSNRTVLSAVLVVAGTYGPIFWAMQSVPSGLSGLTNLALVPIFLFVLATLIGEERPTVRHAVALIVGCAGLVNLFWSRLEGADNASALGLAAIVAGTASICVGSVVARPLIDPVGPLALTLVHSAIGGAALLAIALAIEPISLSTLAAVASPEAIGSLFFLSIFGTIIAYSLYLRLFREWGMARAGLYAFVSPIIALATGAWLFGERIGLPETAGAVLLLVAAGLALFRGSRSVPSRSNQE